jgi:hypothetical protein
MSKRKDGDFERIDKDHYPTPLKPVRYLIRYLQRDDINEFVEPCCGPKECLIQHLESFGLSCVYRGDIIFGQDALQLTKAMCRGAPIISNLPFKYPHDKPRTTRLLRDLIRHFLDIDVPSWLLMPHDFSTNEYAPPFLKHCSEIVVAGRVKWIADSEHDGGFDNSCWYRFDVNYDGKPVFHNDRLPQRRSDKSRRRRVKIDTPIEQAPLNG